MVIYLHLQLSKMLLTTYSNNKHFFYAEVYYKCYVKDYMLMQKYVSSTIQDV